MIYIHYSPQHQQYGIRITFDPVYYVTASPLDWSVPFDEPYVVNSSVDNHVVSSIQFNLTDEWAHEIYSSGLSEHEIIYTVARKEIENLDVPGGFKNIIDYRVRKEIEKSYPSGNLLSTPVGFLAPAEPMKGQLSNQARELPGVRSTVDAPCGCNGAGRFILIDAVIHLNDRHKWTREKIADWLDELADAGEIDIAFPTPDEVDFNREKVGNAGLPPGENLMYMDAHFEGLISEIKSQFVAKVETIESLEDKLKEEK